MAELRTYRVTDRDYPRRLRDLQHPPDPVVIRGDWEGGPAVAIVGTRKASEEAAGYANSLARRLSQVGVIIWSGGAVGIDAAAHRGALDAEGRTVVVTGTGIDECYPKEHAALYDEIVEKGGALASPFEPAQRAAHWTFPARNRVLAAFVDAMVVVQAPVVSGARSASAAARGCGRPVFVVPAYPWDSLGAGNLAEARLGAHLLADERALTDFLAVRPLPPEHPEPLSSERSEPLPLDLAAASALSPACRTVLAVVSVTPRHHDEIAEETGLGATALEEALLTLTLLAVLVEGPSGRYRRINH
jgi:DNA processing protein